MRKINSPKCDKICEICGAEMIGVQPRRKYCDNCKEKNILESRMKFRKRQKEKIEKKKRAVSINSVLQSLEKYNQKHKTTLTYGQYVALMNINDKKAR